MYIHLNSSSNKHSSSVWKAVSPYQQRNVLQVVRSLNPQLSMECLYSVYLILAQHAIRNYLN